VAKIKINVLKTMFNQDPADEYCQADVTPCPAFSVGQEFTVEREKAEGFCDWAWNDINKVYMTLRWGAISRRG
jgi:uncharacterized repeat protein (TIGR04076 family)